MVNIPRILILEQEDELIEEETQFLSDEKAIVTSSSDAINVLESIEFIEPDLIILGSSVPMINGDLPLIQIRKLIQAPILVVGHQEELVYMLEMGADRFISKPLSKALFMATVHSLLRQYYNFHYNGNCVSSCLLN